VLSPPPYIQRFALTQNPEIFWKWCFAPLSKYFCTTQSLNRL